MEVKVLFFASCRTIFGCKEKQVCLSDGATVKGLIDTLAEEVPQWRSMGKKISIAVNTEYADYSQILKDGDEIALIPPVSGGNQ